MTAAACAAVFILLYFLQAKIRTKAVMMPKLIAIGGVILVTWIITSVSTLGLIDKRYANQDAAGRTKGDITTGRLELIDEEMEAFYKYPLTGIGVGKVREYRQAQTGRFSNTHNEVTRILSEHGLFGLLGMLILIVTPLIFRIRNRSNVLLFSFLAFWFLTINHSSMRIAAPSLIYGLALITIINVRKKNTIHRKQVRA